MFEKYKAKGIEPIKNTAWLALLVGFAAYVFSSGRWNIFITVWIWPTALLYFSRNTKSVKQFGILAAVLIMGHVIKWYDILGEELLVSTVLTMLWAFCWVIPFAADRLLIKKFKGVLSTLLFPRFLSALK